MNFEECYSPFGVRTLFYVKIFEFRNSVFIIRLIMIETKNSIQRDLFVQSLSRKSKELGGAFKIEGDYSKIFDVFVGLKQRVALSPIPSTKKLFENNIG